ncbi:hypothetical protein RJT34_24577 [Clitoria ternatea]|uniref:Uncharacterized protein n=1 Tax=Clitoria ternatea TaxID=43366 RepID=A0AAN9FNA8_CLITE
MRHVEVVKEYEKRIIELEVKVTRLAENKKVLKKNEKALWLEFEDAKIDWSLSDSHFQSMKLDVQALKDNYKMLGDEMKSKDIEVNWVIKKFR